MIVLAMKLLLFKKRHLQIVGVMAALAVSQWTNAQNKIDLTNLAAFINPSASWRIAGDVMADLKENNKLVTTPGTGVLVNLPEGGQPGKDLFFNFKHGDADIELDYMMAKGSNSGIYLQGRYEIQLLDSWGVINPKSSDNGSLYERWDEARPVGQKGYDGHPPRQNASRAPGLWQHLKVSFQAPRFDALGKKIENAKILSLVLNGVMVHENLELSAETRGAVSNIEVAQDALRIQGDHGAVAFRNMVVWAYDKPRPKLTDLTYTIYKGAYETEPDYSKLPPEAKGSSIILSSVVSSLNNNFLLRYTGMLEVEEPGEYVFDLRTPGGKGFLKIDDKTLLEKSEFKGKGKLQLQRGKFPFTLLYSKTLDYAKAGLGLSVSGPGIREYIISDNNVPGDNPVDPILVNAPANTILRSFMDVDTIRVTHAVNVGSPLKVNYTYDMDNGMIVQVWRGNFLDATPMWHSRGDGSSRPEGSVIKFGKPMPGIEQLSSTAEAWRSDTASSGFRPKGYVLDDTKRPIFKYSIYGANIQDATRILENGQGMEREISVQNPFPNLYVRLAAGSTIQMISDGMYLINDKSYYIRLDNTNGAMPVIRDADNRKELIIPIQSTIKYSLLF